MSDNERWIGFHAALIRKSCQRTKKYWMKSEVTPRKAIRPLALLLEGLPIVAGVTGIILNQFMVWVIAFLVLGFIYLGGARYLFRGERRHSWFTGLLAHGAGIVYSILLTGIIGKLFRADFAELFLQVGFGTSLLLLLVTGAHYWSYRQKDKLAYRLHLKLMGRLAFFVLFSAWIIFS